MSWGTTCRVPAEARSLANTHHRFWAAAEPDPSTPQQQLAHVLQRLEVDNALVAAQPVSAHVWCVLCGTPWATC